MHHQIKFYVTFFLRPPPFSLSLSLSLNSVTGTFGNHAMEFHLGWRLSLSKWNPAQVTLNTARMGKVSGYDWRLNANVCVPESGADTTQTGKPET